MQLLQFEPLEVEKAMAATLHACRDIAEALVASNPGGCRSEIFKLLKFVSKLNLVLFEVELELKGEEDAEGQGRELHGSIKLFAALETALTALQQAEHVLHQHSTELAGIWATEDAAEFEAVAAELSLAFKKLQQVPELPREVEDDITHFSKQLASLTFSVSELEQEQERETERAREHIISHGKEEKEIIESPTQVQADIPPDKQSPATSAGTTEDDLDRPLPTDPFNMDSSPMMDSTGAAMTLQAHQIPEYSEAVSPQSSSE